jgi:hypothetical protein
MDLSIAVTSKLGISLGTPELDGVDWAEQKIAAHNRNTTERTRLGILASHHELSSRDAPTARIGPYKEKGWMHLDGEGRTTNPQPETLLQTA